jgi:hypothetical protein
MASTLRSPQLQAPAPLACCGVCGSDQIAVDEVWERGLLRLSECRRCENVWTEGPFGGPRGPVARARLRRPAQREAA